MNSAGYWHSNLTGNGITVLKEGRGSLAGVIINNNSTGGTITIYDNVIGAGNTIMTLQIGSPSGGLNSNSGIPGPCPLVPLQMEFSTGLTIVTNGSDLNNITILWY